MNWRNLNAQTLRALLIPSLIALLAACGGGGGGSGGGVTPTGSVSVLVTDLPTDDYCEINVTITRVVLIGEDGQITLYSNPAGKTFNLLDLRGHSEVFSHTTGVPAGTYSKIRLVLAGDVELKPVNSCDDPAGWFEAQVPSGRLDLNPQGEFTVPENGALIVELDMDAKAFKLTQTGNGRWKVRPVVFVNVLTEDGLGKLVRVSGTVENKVDEPDLRSFELCRTDIAWDGDDNDDVSVQPLSDRDDGYRRCVTVSVLGDTSFFDDLGDPATYDAVTEGEYVTVIGRLAVSEMNDGDDRDKLVLNAEVIEVGEPGVYKQWTGIVRSVPVDAEDGFDLEFEPPQGFLQGTIVSVDLQPGTKLYSRTGDAIGVGDFDIGLSARVEGVLVIGDDDFIKSSVVWLDLDADQDLFEGLVDTDSVDVDQRSFTLMPTDSSMPTDRIVYVLPDAIILLVTEDAGSITNERLTLEEMAALGAVYEAEVYGREQIDGRIISDRVVLQAEDGTP
jgi:hypothetical protein